MSKPNFNMDILELLCNLIKWLTRLHISEIDKLRKELKYLIWLERESLANIQEKNELIRALELPEDLTKVLLDADLKRLRWISLNIVTILEKTQQHNIRRLKIQDCPPEEKRRHRRYYSHRKLRVSTQPKCYRKALLLNVSRGGAYIRSDEILSSGDSILVELPAIDSIPPKQVKATVVKPVQNRLHLEFSNLIEESYASRFEDVSNAI